MKIKTIKRETNKTEKMPKLSKMKFKKSTKIPLSLFHVGMSPALECGSQTLFSDILHGLYAQGHCAAGNSHSLYQKVLIADSILVKGGSCCPPLLSGTPSGLNPSCSVPAATVSASSSGHQPCCVWNTVSLELSVHHLQVLQSRLLFHIASWALRGEVGGRHPIQD